MGEFLIWSEYYNQFDIYQLFRVSLLEPRQSNLSNPEAYSEPSEFRISKMVCFANSR